MDRRAAASQDGFSLVEMLVSVTVLLLCTTGLTQLLIHNSRINKAQQMTAAAQADARNCLSLIVQKLRSAGWDPRNAGIPTVVLDTNTGDNISEIEVFADLDEDFLTDSPDEQVLIRHVGDRVVWRRSNDATDPFVVVATNISNDENGDGVPEPMFVPSSAPDPSSIVIRITAESPAPDPLSGRPIRYTLSSAVVLRKTL